MPQPTIGRTVLYRLSDADTRHIQQQRTHNGVAANAARTGDRYPAVVVSTPGGESVNLQVSLDGPDTLWAASRHEGDEPGTWAWPTRV